jgi:hypothetical protein
VSLITLVRILLRYYCHSVNMIFKITALLAILPIVTAWPQVMEMNERLRKREEPPPRDPVFRSGRPNTGLPPLGFNAREQFVNVTRGSGHEFASPGSGDIRGQCPGYVSQR